jgi:hypothetical protein
MPPQQPHRLLDLFDDALNFRAHAHLLASASLVSCLAFHAPPAIVRVGAGKLQEM